MNSPLVQLCVWLNSKNRGWLAFFLGFTYALALAPFDGDFSFWFIAFPFLSFIIFIPFFFLATVQKKGNAYWHMYLYGVSASFVQFYWIAFDKAEGVWHLILLGLVLASLVFGLLFLVFGMAARSLFRIFPNSSYIFIPAVFVIIEYLRTLSDMAFPWAFMGYSLISITPLAQMASLGGVYILSFVIMCGNVLIFSLTRSQPLKGVHKRNFVVFLVLLLLFSAWGFFRVSQKQKSHTITVALLQTNMDQNNWSSRSIDSCFSITGAMVKKAGDPKPDLMVLPESALLCFLSKNGAFSQTVRSWHNQIQTPLIIGALDWNKEEKDTNVNFNVYNTAFLVDTGSTPFVPYYKMRLVPFSEALPFEGIMPIISRVNLGEADFKRGTTQTVFSISNKIKAAPFICYEMIFPNFVRNRVVRGANLLIQITNDGWFGKSSAAYQHAAMARMRCVENGVSLVRSANSGISLIANQFGKIQIHSKMYERTSLRGEVDIKRIPTLYTQWGDWFVCVCGGVVALAVLLWAIAKKYLVP